jgi:hypothetical protein
MKNTAYRKGNLVKVKHGPHPFLATIAAIKKDDDLIVELRNGVCYIHSSEDVSGIPITEEWFREYTMTVDEDGDFTVFFQGKTDYGVKFCLTRHSLSLRKKQEWFSFCIIHPGGPYTHLCNIYHIHELQNLIFALTGEELELKKEVADGPN